MSDSVGKLQVFIDTVSKWSHENYFSTNVEKDGTVVVHVGPEGSLSLVTVTFMARNRTKFFFLHILRIQHKSGWEMS